MSKSYRDGRAKGLSYYSEDGYGYDRNRSGKGFKVTSRQDNRQKKNADRQAVYFEHERVVNS